ncbi:hypothetical protein RFI_37492 [Reticulomyxa filosa]|uniref:Uncharacterized protein n=1 Tax=Reticulomyxa filosa TaxID=46433 RepID=X6LFR8_RETFI|nr:hypothetical protein RFI_37492 [Reticulomyxa filosa]|eukprot:ETN99966.1 hypothetical protein RFI_37492 [Reticulomyxa filosa]
MQMQILTLIILNTNTNNSNSPANDDNKDYMNNNHNHNHSNNNNDNDENHDKRLKKTHRKKYHWIQKTDSDDKKNLNKHFTERKCTILKINNTNMGFGLKQASNQTNK